MKYVFKAIQNILIYIVLPITLLSYLFIKNILYGILALLAMLLYLIYKNLPAIYSKIGKLFYAQGNLDQALNFFKKASSKKYPKPDILISYSYLLLKKGDIETPDKIIDELLERTISHNKKAAAKAIKALVIWKKGDLDSAIGMLEEIISIVETTSIYASLGYMYIEKGDLAKALDFNLKAFDYNSDSSIIADNLALAYYHNGNINKALEIYEKIMSQSIKPAFAEAYYNYALVLKSSGDIEKAISNAKKSLEFNLSFLSTITTQEIETLIDDLIEK